MVHMYHYLDVGGQDKIRPVRSNEAPQRASARIFHPRASVHAPWCPSGKLYNNRHILAGPTARRYETLRLCGTTRLFAL